MTAVGNLKADSNEIYHLVVLAQDGGKPARTSTGKNFRMHLIYKFKFGLKHNA